VLSAATSVKGNIRGAGALRIAGSVAGNVDVDGDVALEPGSSVDGDITAASVTISGKLDGDASATGPVSVKADAEVSGVLKGSQVSIEAGAAVSVRLDTEFELDN